MRRTLLGLALVVASQGCAAVLAKPAPARVDRGSYPECGTPGAAMVSDVILGVAGGMILVAGAADGESGGLAVGGVMTGMFVGSAIYGILVQNTCEEARATATASLGIQPLRARARGDTPLGPAGPPAAPAAPAAPQPPSIPSENQ